MTRTINQVLIDLRTQIAASGSETAALDADVLMRHVLRVDRTRLALIKPDPFPEAKTAELDALARRRIAGEPISLLIGHREFFGLDFIVTPDVLTPRPETEMLVEWARDWLHEHPAARVIDIGTGSGAIAVSIAAYTSANVTASDVSPAALAVARQNAENHVPERLTYIESDLFSAIPERYDLILTNLPYLTPTQLAERRELAFEPELALVSGSDGLDLIRRLIASLPDHLNPGGEVALECDPGQAALVAGLLLQTHILSRVKIHHDYAGHARFVTAHRL